MARNMYELITRKRAPQWVKEEPGFRDTIPSAVHVWVLGESGWSTQDSREIYGITEGDSDPFYRVIIAGCDVENVVQKQGVYLSDWAGWPTTAGMYRRKKHHDLSKFRNEAKSLLMLLSENYLEKKDPGTDILDQMGIPYSYYGDL